MEPTKAQIQAAQRFGLAGASTIERYLIYSSFEIQRLLLDISSNSELVTMYFDGSNEFVMTAVLAVGSTTVMLDYGAREDLNRRVLASEKLIFVTSRDRIKVQWLSQRAEKVMFEGKPAFRIAMPQSVLRLQRREFYRLAAPLGTPLKCSMTVGPPEEPKKIDIVVTDVSLGGIAVQGPIETSALEIGKRYENCEMMLPGLGKLTFTLEVANNFEITMKNGHRAVRSGCQFSGLGGRMLLLLQRYINRIERERHERMARFG